MFGDHSSVVHPYRNPIDPLRRARLDKCTECELVREEVIARVPEQAEALRDGVPIPERQRNDVVRRMVVGVRERSDSLLRLDVSGTVRVLHGFLDREDGWPVTRRTNKLCWHVCVFRLPGRDGIVADGGRNLKCYSFDWVKDVWWVACVMRQGCEEQYYASY